MLSQGSKSIVATALVCIFALLAFNLAEADDHQLRRDAEDKAQKAEKAVQQGKYEQAVQLYQQALEIIDQTYHETGPGRNFKINVSNELADLYEKLGHVEQARKLRESLRPAQNTLEGTSSNSGNKPSGGCDPNWSPKFSQVTFGGFDNSPASVRQLTDQQVAKYGGVDQSIKQVESEKANYQQQLVQQQNDGNVDGVNQVQQLILFSDGMLDILRCRQQISAQANSSSAVATSRVEPTPVPSGSVRSTSNPQVPAEVDIRYMQVDSRPLTDAEMTEVRNSLRWEPDSVPLAPGGAGRSNLVDDKGRKLGSVLVRWEKPSAPKTAQRTQQNHFTVQVENGSSCVFLSSAELDDSQGFIVVSGVTWSGWLTLHQPDRGQTSQVKGDAPLPQTYPSLVLKPLTAYSTLSACLTPRNPK